MGTGAAVVVVELTEEVVDDALSVVLEVPPLARWAGGDEVEPTANPMAVPPPRATRMSTPTPIRTTVLFRIVMSRRSLSTTNGNGTSGRGRSEEWQVVDQSAAGS